jgi:O-6-methylguanine DNA methyltransferase
MLVTELRRLGEVEAPATLRVAVLTDLGLGDAYFTLVTPLGAVYVAHNGNGVSAVRRGESDAAFEALFRAEHGRPAWRMDEPPERLVSALTRALAGMDHPTLRFDLRGLSEFERAVLLKSLEIPRGEVRPYAWIAREIGRPGAVRAVGSALGRNPVPLFIPCHRVVRSDGQMGQYSLGGTNAKRVMLAAEGLAPDALEELARAGTRYIGCVTTHVYCFPTCRHARRVAEPHQVAFGSEAAATAAGYRPCEACRPARAS